MIRFFSFSFSIMGDKPYFEGGDQSLLPDAPIYDIIAGTMDWLLAILGFIAIIGFVISGILYLTSAGNDGQTKTAKEAMKWSLVGVIVALAGYVVVLAVDTWLSAGTQF